MNYDIFFDVFGGFTTDYIVNSPRRDTVTRALGSEHIWFDDRALGYGTGTYNALGELLLLQPVAGQC